MDVGAAVRPEYVRTNGPLCLWPSQATVSVLVLKRLEPSELNGTRFCTSICSWLVPYQLFLNDVAMDAMGEGEMSGEAWGTFARN